MSFIITGIIKDSGQCRIPGHVLSAIDPKTGFVLASTQLREGNELEFHLEYELAEGVPNEPHEVVLIGTRQAIRGKTLKTSSLTQVGQGVGVEARIAVSEWVLEGNNYVVANRLIYIDCCCILWALLGIYTIKGKVIHDPSGLPLSGVTVEARDFDLFNPSDPLGSDVTDGDGRFRIQVPYSTFAGEPEEFPLFRPDLQFRVTMPGSGDNQGCVCLDFNDDIIRWNWPNCKPITLEVPCCLAIIEHVGGWDAHFYSGEPPVPGEPVGHAARPAGRGINSGDCYAYGLNAKSMPGQVAEYSVFGGRVTLCGAKLCKHGEKYRFMVGRWADETTPPAPADYIPVTTPFDEMVYAGFEFMFIPGVGFVPVLKKSSVHQAPTVPTDPNAGFYDIHPNSETGCLMAPWNTNDPKFPDGKYSIYLTIRTKEGCEFNSSSVCIRIDNTPPTIELNVDVEDCATITVGDIVTGTLTVQDEHFHSYRLSYIGDGVSGVLAERFYTGVGDKGDVNVAWSWDTTGLPACGYRLALRAWDRAIVNDSRASGEPGFGHQVPKDIYYCLGENN